MADSDNTNNIDLTKLREITDWSEDGYMQEYKIHTGSACHTVPYTVPLDGALRKGSLIWIERDPQWKIKEVVILTKGAVAKIIKQRRQK